jgi:hypothetical protein
MAGQNHGSDRHMTRIYRYILENDGGIAPCVDRQLVTLATCKPRIRAGAVPGDWVMGFYPRPFERGLLAWAGRVARVFPAGDYEKEYRGRRDAVYRQDPDGSYRRLRPDYHPGPDEMRKDLSAPILIFDVAATWYFGDAPELLPANLLHLQAGGRGHRVSGTQTGDSGKLLSWLKGIKHPGIHGRPRHGSIAGGTIRACAGRRNLGSILSIAIMETARGTGPGKSC